MGIDGWLSGEVSVVFRGAMKGEMNIRGSLEDDYLDIINAILATSRRAHSLGEFAFSSIDTSSRTGIVRSFVESHFEVSNLAPVLQLQPFLMGCCRVVQASTCRILYLISDAIPVDFGACCGCCYAVPAGQWSCHYPLPANFWSFQMNRGSHRLYRGM